MRVLCGGRLENRNHARFCVATSQAEQQTWEAATRARFNIVEHFGMHSGNEDCVAHARYFVGALGPRGVGSRPGMQPPEVATYCKKSQTRPCPKKIFAREHTMSPPAQRQPERFLLSLFLSDFSDFSRQHQPVALVASN